MTEDLLTDRIFKGVSISKPFACRGAGDAEVPRQTCNIVITYRNTRMAAAVAWTFVAVESHDVMDTLDRRQKATLIGQWNRHTT